MNRANKAALQTEVTTPHLGCKWTLTGAIRRLRLQDDCFSNTEKKSPLQMTSNTWPKPILGELDVVASYFDDDAVVSAISLIFTGIAEPRLADVTVYRSGCTEIVHILTGLCTEVVSPYVPKWSLTCTEVVCTDVPK